MRSGVRPWGPSARFGMRSGATRFEYIERRRSIWSKPGSCGTNEIAKYPTRRALGFLILYHSTSALWICIASAASTARPSTVIPLQAHLANVRNTARARLSGPAARCLLAAP